MLQRDDDSSPHSLFAAASIAASAAFLLCGYEFVRSPANTLFKAAYGKQALPYVTALVPVGVLLTLYIYGRLLTWLGPRRTLLVTTLASAVVLAIAYAGVRAHWRPASALLFIVKESYIVLLIEQYWSFLNSTLGVATARKLNGPICGVASIGAIAGDLLVGRLATSLGTSAFVLLGAAATLPAALLSEWAYRRCGEPQRLGHEPEPREHRDPLGLRLFGRYRVLGLIASIVVLSQVVSTLLDLNFQGVLQDAIPSPDRQTAFSGNFFAALNAAALVMQFAAAPLLLHMMRAAVVQAAIPLLHVGTCAYLLASPSLRSAGLAYLAFKAVDYSIFKAAKEVLYIPLPYDARYRAKEVVDVFGYRAGKGATSVAVAALQQIGVMMSSTAYAGAALGSAALWGVFAAPFWKVRSPVITAGKVPFVRSDKG